MAKMEELLKQLEQDYASSAEAAKLLAKATGEKVNSGHIRRLVGSGKLTAITIDNRLHVERASIDKLAKAGWKPGDKPDFSREHKCYNIWLVRETADKEIAAITKALGREVKIKERKYYHKVEKK